MKLTKTQIKSHNQACELLKKDVLTEDDKEFVLQNWHEGANHVNSEAGAFFTPLDMAYDFALETHGDTIIDLCAGIGTLSYAIWQRRCYTRENLKITCVEINPDYIAVGKKILPEATWIQANVFDLIHPTTKKSILARADTVISNPPFGRVPRHNRQGPNYGGAEFEFHVIDIASKLGDYGVFILPQNSAGFKYSGKVAYTRDKDGKAADFQNKMGYIFEMNCGIDTSVYRDQWRGTSPATEIICVDFNGVYT